MNAKFLEKWGPLIFSLVITVLILASGNKIIKSDSVRPEKVEKVLELTVTFVTIILGFMGAILPVLFSMRSESEIVQRIFQFDVDGLFQKYVLSTILTGILLIVISAVRVLGNVFTFDWIYRILAYLWYFFVTYFLSSTYRSMKFIIQIIFSTSGNKDIKRNDKTVDLDGTEYYR